MASDVTDLRLCRFGETASPARTVLVVGNSHALRIVPALEAYGQARGWQIILAAHTDCMGLSAKPSEPASSAERACATWSAAVLDHVLTTRPDVVLFASHLNAEEFIVGKQPAPAEIFEGRRHVVDSWMQITGAGIPVLVTGDVPGLRPLLGPECLAKSEAVIDPCAVPRRSVERPNLMTEVAQAESDLVSYAPLTDLLCDDTTCHAVIGGVVVYSDSHHLTATFSRSIAPAVGSAVADAFEK